MITRPMSPNALRRPSPTAILPPLEVPAPIIATWLEIPTTFVTSSPPVLPRSEM
jgi:hypothetical protein